MNIYESRCFTDTDVLVNGLVSIDEEKHLASKELLKEVERGDTTLVTDFLALTETFHILAKYKGEDTATEMIRKLLSLSGFATIPLDEFTYFEALKRVGRYNLKFNDLIHYTVALLQNVSGIYSYDKHFKGLEIKRIEP